jgi:hypothetical protein
MSRGAIERDDKTVFRKIEINKAGQLPNRRKPKRKSTSGAAKARDLQRLTRPSGPAAGTAFNPTCAARIAAPKRAPNSGFAFCIFLI